MEDNFEVVNYMYNVAMDYIKENKYNLAIKELIKIIEEEDFEAPAVYNLLGLCYIKKSKFSKALEYLKTGCELNSELRSRCITKYNMSECIYNEEEEIKKLDLSLTYNTAYCYYMLGNYKQSYINCKCAEAISEEEDEDIKCLLKALKKELSL